MGRKPRTSRPGGDRPEGEPGPGDAATEPEGPIPAAEASPPVRAEVPAEPEVPADPSTFVRPWVQLRSYTYAPAVWPGFIRDCSRDAKAGSWVHVYDRAGRHFGLGLWNGRARIPLRVLVHGEEPVAEEAWFSAALGRAAALRRELVAATETDAWRVVNSDGDGLSGLTVDRYGEVLSVEVSSLGMWQRLPRLLPLLHEQTGTRAAVVRVDAEVARLEGIPAGAVVPGLAPGPRKVRVREHGVRYEVDFAEGHKTGFFCDQRENRRRLAALVRGRRVLDLCCYTGGFALSAAVAGAVEVTGVDLDEEAVAQARRNAQLNGLSTSTTRWVHADAFAYARQMQRNGEAWDVVVCDPPKLILSRDGYGEGRGKYEDLNRLALGLVKPGGLFVTCSCSGQLAEADFEQFVIHASHKVRRRLQFFEKTGAGPDHPVVSNCLESRYLKVLWARVE